MQDAVLVSVMMTLVNSRVVRVRVSVLVFQTVVTGGVTVLDLVLIVDGSTNVVVAFNVCVMETVEKEVTAVLCQYMYQYWDLP